MWGGIAVFFITGISNALFGSFFATCAVVLKNTSSGFWSKFVNHYFSHTASTELTDGEFILVMMIYWGLIWTTWMLGSYLLQSAKKLANEMECVSRQKENQEDENNSSDQEISQERLAELESRVKRHNRAAKWKGWCVRLISIVLLYGMSLDFFAYGLVKGLRQDIIRIRPFITDNEFHQLNRQWVMMKSGHDYLHIRRQIEEYEKRGEDNDTDGEDEVPK